MFLVATVLYFCVDAELSLTGRPTMDMLLGLGVLNLGTYLWIRTLSGFHPGTQFRTIGILFALEVLLFASIQMEGVYGNGRPVFAWRWKSLPADQYRSQTPGQTGSIATLPSTAAWPQFRGPRRDGISPARLANWNAASPVELWRQPIGSGWSSFAVAGEYCFTMEQRADEECVTCYEIKTGHQVWIHRNVERFSEITGGEGPRSTPTYDNGLLYTLGATGVLNCLDATNGELIWTVDILKTHDALNCYYGMCTSPLVVGNKVIVNPGGKQASLAAYDKRNGDLVWSGGDAESSYASPHHVRLCGVDQILNFNAEGVYAHDLENGSVLWSIPWISNEAERNNVCQPIQISENQILISSGYGRGTALFEFSRISDRFDFRTVWQNKKLRSKFASAVFDGKSVFGLDEGILVCLDARTGERHWKNGRYRHGQILLAGEYLIVQSEEGYIAQVAATTDEFREYARIEALDRRTWTHPVVTDNYLLTRNDREMVCYALSN